MNNAVCKLAVRTRLSYPGNKEREILLVMQRSRHRLHGRKIQRRKTYGDIFCS